MCCTHVSTNGNGAPHTCPASPPAVSAHNELCHAQDSIDEYPYSTYMYLIERLNEIENLCVALRPMPAA